MRIKGHNGVPVITCLGGSDDTSNDVTVEISDVYLENAILSLSNINITITNSLFNNVSLISAADCHHLRMVVRNTTFSKAVTCKDVSNCSTHGDHDVVCDRVYITIEDVRVHDSKLQIKAEEIAEVNLSNSTFTKVLQSETGMGGVNVSVPAWHGHLTVHNCVFSYLVHWEPILSAINIEAAALRIEALRPRGNFSAHDAPARDNSIVIRNTSFVHNERALSISRSFRSIEIQDCLFAHNKVMHAAAAVRLALDVSTIVNNPYVLFCDGFKLRITNQNSTITIDIDTSAL